MCMVAEGKKTVN